MVSQNEALTKDKANLEGYRQNPGYQADRQSATTTGSSFSGALREVLDLDQTVVPAFINGETRTGKGVYADVTISFSAMEVYRRGELVALTRKEFQTLAYFLKNARRVISRDELLDEVWGYGSYPCTRTVDNHILQLRKKLEPEPARPKHFRTVRGMGYKFLA